jgi:hypothetical protein
MENHSQFIQPARKMFIFFEQHLHGYSPFEFTRIRVRANEAISVFSYKTILNPGKGIEL